MKILIAGIGNIFLGDDGFGVEVAKRLANRRLPEGVQVVDFGIRGMDLVYALLEDYDTVILVDAAPRGGKPGDLYLVEPQPGGNGEVSLDIHGMEPVKVLALARAMGARPTKTFLIACEPGTLASSEDYEDVLVLLSVPVQAAVDEAVRMVESLLEELRMSQEITSR